MTRLAYASLSPLRTRIEVHRRYSEQPDDLDEAVDEAVDAAGTAAVLDVDCGTGSLLRRLAGNGAGRRLVVCSTNAIESLNARYRRAVRARGHFLTEQAALNVCTWSPDHSTHRTRPGQMGRPLEARPQCLRDNLPKAASFPPRPTDTARSVTPNGRSPYLVAVE